jgi:acyl-CoA synthetase (AMP-forming)/AMP-acid ligase II
VTAPLHSPIAPPGLAGRRSLVEALAAVVAEHGERPALVEMEGGRPRLELTYAQFWARVQSTAQYLRTLGAYPGATVLNQLGNNATFLVAAFATWLEGAVHVGLDWDLTAAELERIGSWAQAPVILSASPPALTDMLKDRSTATLARREAIDALAEHHTPPLGAASADGRTLPRPEDPAIVFLTSGTTGTVKGALGRHGPVVFGWQELAKSLAFSAQDRHLVQLPLSHGFGLMTAVAALFSGGRLVIMDRFNATEAVQLIHDHAITVFNGTPTHFILLLQALEPTRRLPSLRTGVVSAATLPADTRRDIFERLGMGLMVLYGSSEGLSVRTQDRGDIMLGAVGRPPPGSLRIVDPKEEPVPPGSTGEIVLHCYMPVEYWREPCAREIGSWYKTGDVGRVDADGRLYVLGRVNDQVNRGGQKIEPGEVEAALSDCQGVADCAVIGIADPVLGEILCACVVPAGAAPTLAELRQHAASQLARHKLPEAILVLAAIPRSRLGKIDRPTLRRLADHAHCDRHR